MEDVQTSVMIKPLGGIAGDMFAGACAALWPDLVPHVLDDLRAADLPDGIEVAFRPASVNGFSAMQFHVAQTAPVGHTSDYAAITAALEASSLPTHVRRHALAIFEVLGRAEAKIHGVPLERVHFHELADWDSIADVVAAASFIARARVRHWAVGPLPLGGGTVRTQHGRIPVPAPAVLEILKDFSFIDDGVAGERVTPTGAAIVRHLAGPNVPSVTGTLQGAGFGAGTKRFEGLANVVQLVAFQGAGQTHEPVTELAFDIDDMTPEELGTALDHLRAADGALDVTQTPQIGKKGRAIFLVRLLCRPGHAEPLTDLIFAETSTLGVRRAALTRTVLPRHVRATVEGEVKLAERPGGATAKVESDALATTSGLAPRRAQARAAEAEAMAAEGADD
ncbi:MAG: LarC family nickel insertion protein [Pseudomonadota bacterium]